MLRLKLSLRKPYITGLVTTLVMPDKWQRANMVSILLELSNILNASIRMLNKLRGAQDTKKIIVTVISILFVLLLRAICLDLL